MKDPQPIHVRITPAPLNPDRAKVKRMMARLYTDHVTDAAVDQLIKLLPAVNRWLAEDPNAAAKFLDGPVAALDAMRKSGALTGEVGDLLALLRSGPRSQGTGRAKLMSLFRVTSVSFDERRKRENG